MLKRIHKLMNSVIGDSAAGGGKSNWCHCRKRRAGRMMKLLAYSINNRRKDDAAD